MFVALGGTSYAVIKLPAKSVGNRELKSNAITSPDVIATLPPGYRPTVRSVFVVATGSNPTGQLGGRVDVVAGGDILWISGAPGDGNFTSLETISFWTD